MRRRVRQKNSLALLTLVSLLFSRFGLLGWHGRLRREAQTAIGARLQSDRGRGQLEHRQHRIHPQGGARCRHRPATGRCETQPGEPDGGVALFRQPARRRDRLLARGRDRLGGRAARDPVGGNPRDPHGSRHRGQRRLSLCFDDRLGLCRGGTASRALAARAHARRSAARSVSSSCGVRWIPRPPTTAVRASSRSSRPIHATA